jgi:hypothetical protein
VRNRRFSLALGGLAAVALALFVWGGLEPAPELAAGAPAPPDACLAAPRWSLLVTGDTGKYRPWRPWAEGQRAVGRGLELEDRRAPADGLLLLGDNFYPDGLLRHELVARVRRNVVLPFCRFAAAEGPRWGEVADACQRPAAERRPVPIFAVLGNHDHKGPESPELERLAIPEFVSNWRLSEGVAEVVEPAPGVSLVLADSEQLAESGSFAPLRDALARAPGPWRILALHHPVALREGKPPGRYEAGVARAVAEAGRAVQLVLSGHRHDLQIIELPPPYAGLHVISGAGSQPRELRVPPFAGRRFGVGNAAGFARLDLGGEGAAEGVCVSLFTTPRSPIYFWRAPRLVSRWWVGRDARTGQLFPAPKSPASSPSSSSTR